MPIYMKYGEVKGDVTEQGHKDWVELQSCQMGVNRHITTGGGRGQNREASAPAISEIVITKERDTASGDLFKHSLFGDGQTTKIHFLTTGGAGDKLESYLEIEMENTLVSSYSLSGAGGDSAAKAMESLSLNFTKITYNNIVRDIKNKPGSPSKVGWDLAEAKKL